MHLEQLAVYGSASLSFQTLVSAIAQCDAIEAQFI
jgi:hypothetical protein